MPFRVLTTNVQFGTWPATTRVVRTVTFQDATGSVTAALTGAAAPYSVTMSMTTAVVAFEPAAVGYFGATLTLTDGSGATASVALGGTAVANVVTFDPAALHFGSVIVGAPTNLTTLVTAGFPVDLTITAGAFTVPSPPVVTGTPSTVIFTPGAVGAFTATVGARWRLPTDAVGVTLPTPTSTCAVDGTGVLAVTPQASTTGVSGTRQRLLIDVPNPPAQMTLGARVLNTNAGGAIIDGFGLGTPGHGFLNASGGSSNLWLRAMKSLVLEARDSDSTQSGEGIWMVSNGNLAATCAGTASFVGAGGVVIAANKGPAPGEDGNPTNTTSSLEDPPKTDKAEERQGIASKAATAFGAMDAIIAFTFGARGLYNVVKGAREDSKMPFTSVAATVGIVGAMGGFAGFSAGVSGLAGKLSGVTIYGEAGVVIGSGGFTGIHSLTSLVLSSVFPLMFGVDAEVFAVDALTLTGMRHATLASHKDVTVQSDGDVKIKANGGGFGPIGTERLGKVEVLGKHSIRIQAEAATVLMPIQSSYVDVKPAGVLVDANTTLDLRAGTAPGFNPMNEAKIAMKSARADFAVGRYGLRIVPAAVSMGHKMPDGSINPNGPFVAVDRDVALAAADSHAYLMLYEDGRVSLSGARSNGSIQIGDQNITLTHTGRVQIV